MCVSSTMPFHAQYIRVWWYVIRQPWTQISIQCIPFMFFFLLLFCSLVGIHSKVAMYDIMNHNPESNINIHIILCLFLLRYSSLLSKSMRTLFPCGFSTTFNRKCKQKWQLSSKQIKKKEGICCNRVGEAFDYYSCAWYTLVALESIDDGKSVDKNKNIKAARANKKQETRIFNWSNDFPVLPFHLVFVWIEWQQYQNKKHDDITTK